LFPRIRINIVLCFERDTAEGGNREDENVNLHGAMIILGAVSIRKRLGLQTHAEAPIRFNYSHH